jgi:hypothetical protein
MASVFIANRLKSSSLLHDERISGSCQRHLPIAMRRVGYLFGGIVKPIPDGKEQRLQTKREIIKTQNKNDKLRNVPDSSLLVELPD